MPIQLGCELPRVELERELKAVYSWVVVGGRRIEERFFNVTNVWGRKFNVRIKLPFPSLKGKTGGVERSTWVV